MEQSRSPASFPQEYDVAMGAFRRRTQFAAPLIFTVAASCGSKGSEPPRKNRFPRTTWAVRMNLPGCKATVDMDINCPPNEACVVENPPPPQDIECPPGASGKTTQRVAQLADLSCVLVPEGCFELGCAKTPAPCPLPPGQTLVHKIAFAWHIEKRGESCHVEEEDHDCPPGMDCNPPKPRMIPCPPGITEDKDVEVTKLVDGTCVIVPEGCKDLGCAVDKTPCPPS